MENKGKEIKQEEEMTKGQSNVIKVLIVIIILLIIALIVAVLYKKTNLFGDKDNPSKGNNVIDNVPNDTNGNAESCINEVNGVKLAEGQCAYDSKRANHELTNDEYAFNHTENGDVVFYRGDTVYNTFKCDAKKCDVEVFSVIGYNYGAKYHATNSGKVLIVESLEGIADYGYHMTFYGENGDSYGNVILYDIKTSEQTKFEKVHLIMLTQPSYDIVKVLQYVDGSYMLVSNDGKVIRKKAANSLKLSCYEGCNVVGVDYKNDILIAKNNGKYGIEKLSTGEMIASNKFDDISFIDGYDGGYKSDKYLIGTINNKQNLYNMKDGTQVTKNGYEKIKMLGDNTLMVYNDKTFSFIDLNENKLTDAVIKLNNQPCGWMPKLPEGYRVTIKETVAEIYVNDVKDNENCINCTDCPTYEYNLVTNELKKIEKSN